MTSKPITDQAEVSIDFPDKFYHGSFSHSSRYDVKADGEGLHLYLQHQTGEKRQVGFHLHYYLLAELLAAAAEETAKVEGLQPPVLEKLREAGALWQKVGTEG
ncbi:MAG: hypothetical protein KDC18_00650 [Alphaproteobacteria bacterium]|nr:hypothetical protein [Alphaproteobacteria bacterium]MCB9929834.1 hypothetical protein [Alphaproteobacteria bacterium]